MKILLVTQYFWPESFKINEVATYLVQNGHNVEVLTGIPNYPNGRKYAGYKNNFGSEYYNNIKINRVPIILRGSGSSKRLFLNYLSFVFFATFRIFGLGKPDIVFVYEPSPITVVLPAIFINKFWKKPIYFWVQDIWPDSVKVGSNIKNKFVLQLLDKLVAYIYKNCTQILISCEGFRKKIVKFGVKDSKINYVPNPGENIFLVNQLEKVESNKLTDGFKIIFGGNIGTAQDFETVLAAAYKLKRITELKWIIIGEGRRYKWLKEEVNRLELNDSLILLGQKPLSEMPKYFAQADILLLNLKKEKIFELTVPSKLQSYMAAGKPIIAGLSGDGRRIIEKAKCGVVCNPENIAELTDAVLYLYDKSHDERELLGNNAKNYFYSTFHIDIVVKKLEELFRIKIEDKV